MKRANFSKVERRVGHIASRRARRQLMQVPWNRFHNAYEKYIRWQAFALWARAAVESEGCAPPWLEAILRKRCPGFVEETASSRKPELPVLQLLPWIHDRIFRFAKQEGWLDALVFYGFRDTRSQGHWTYWEGCESDWKKRRPAPFPTFAQWRRSALNWKPQGDVSFDRLTKSVQNFLDFEALVYWLRPLFRKAKVVLPPHVTLELKQESPSLLEFMIGENLADNQHRPRHWQRLLNWGKDHVLWQAKKEGWLKFVLRQTSSHPYHVRIKVYSAFWSKSREDNPASPHPSYREWRRAAEIYIGTSQKPFQ